MSPSPRRRVTSIVTGSGVSAASRLDELGGESSAESDGDVGRELGSEVLGRDTASLSDQDRVAVEAAAVTGVEAVQRIANVASPAQISDSDGVEVVRVESVTRPDKSGSSSPEN